MAICKDCSDSDCDHDERCDDCGKCISCGAPGAPPALPRNYPTTDNWLRKLPPIGDYERFEVTRATIFPMPVYVH